MFIGCMCNAFFIIRTSSITVKTFESFTILGRYSISFILLDEADFFPAGQQQDARQNIEILIPCNRFLNSIKLEA
jgi:hypothetical protein